MYRRRDHPLHFVFSQQILKTWKTLKTPSKSSKQALQQHFKGKRDRFLSGIADCGIKIDFQPEGTFYVWANLEDLPSPINQCLVFFEELLKEKCICVPGIFFDINPGKRRHIQGQSKFSSYVRFSYGPETKNLELGIKAIQKVVAKFKKN